ncbi:hypothetical protein Tco_0846736 [Tanacetum coccineum]
MVRWCGGSCGGDVVTEMVMATGVMVVVVRCGGSEGEEVGASFTQGKVSNIPTVFSWCDSISPNGFLPYHLLLLVIIVVFAIVVMVILVVVVGEVLGTVTVEEYRFSSFKPADETNSPFRTFEIERLAAHKLFVAIFSCYESFSWSGVPSGIVSIYHGSSL